MLISPQKASEGSHGHKSDEVFTHLVQPTLFSEHAWQVGVAQEALLCSV